MFSQIEIASFTRESKYAKSSMSVKDVDFYRILVSNAVFGDTRVEDEDNRKVCALFHLFPTMKKIFTFILLSIIAFNAIHAKITWNLSDDGTLTISGTNMPDGAPWDSQRNEIKKVVIENGVTNIGEFAFEACFNLTSVTIPNSVKAIRKHAFAGCYSLVSVSIPNSVTTIGQSAFNGCSSLTSLIIPNSVVIIGWAAFAYCSGLTSINIGNYVRDIGYKAFWGCSSLEQIIMTAGTLPNFTAGDFADGLYETAVLYVPSSLYDEYSSTSPWNKFTNIVGIPDESISLINAENLAADKAVADPVIAKINAIGNVEYTDVCKCKIDDANTAYEALTDDQKALVTNLDVLTTAQQAYDNLKAAAEKLAADKAKADAVIAKISAIGKVEYTDACKGKIDAANKVYNALTADQKALVTNLDVLNKAQQTYETLKAAAEKLIADKAAFNKYKSEIIAIIEALVKDDDSDAVKEIIKKAISDIESLEYEEAISIDDNKAKVQSFVTSVNESVENQRTEDKKTNGIEELEFAEKVNIYDLNGRKITNSMLKSGLYIRNGKKILVK